MASSWNPHSHNDKGQWDMQSSSSDDWTALTNTKWKLLEHFVRHLAQSNLKTKPTKSKKPQASDALKARLTEELNLLVRQYLKPPFAHLDCHPKTALPHLSLERCCFSGNIQLQCIRDPKSRMSDALLSTAFEKMAVRTHQMWLDDIKDGYYKVVRKPSDEDEEHQVEEEEDEEED
ncbi:hypothetical protein DFH28DRAFT_1078743 [Melampsora americana]|nr:hypothetical protein DFH28DRAFT_1078743 [Melampsora americana]